MQEFIIENRKIMLYPSTLPDRPVIYFNTFDEEGEKVHHILQEQACPDFTLVTISELDWNHDMSPWSAPAVFAGDTDFSGGAGEYLKVLTEKILPQAEKEVKGRVLWRGIVGYSLAGLFAVYSLYQTDLFSRAASMSGSFWFSGFKEYAVSHEMRTRPEGLYFSLGGKECKTRHPVLKTVQESTQELETFYRAQGISTIFQLNPGNHYKDTAARAAAGIRWILER
ncbi:MAG: alpha/beta hydrolase [Lachnospiraceae bacterium]|nr:alpha/beta hydrolase [Lachnospiraceae bacterium]